VRNLLRAQGHSSDIFALTVDDDLVGEIRPFADPEARRGDITILHFAVPSPMSEALGNLSGGRVIQYHNITPAHFFAPYDAEIFRLASLGRVELERLVGHVDLALGDSEYNRRELEEVGFQQTAVCPIVVDTDRVSHGAACPALESTLGDGLTNILFVGRIAPNKKIEDHIRLAEHYKRYVDTDYRFIFVGKTDAVPRYYATLRALMLQYEMPSDRFLFVGPVPDDELGVYYRTASAYVSLSEHEGFCVPLVEAMATDLPILAYGGAAVPETLGGAGLCFTPKDLEYAAELLGMVVYDEDLRREVIAGQRRRLDDFGAATVERALESMIASLT
jgi:glycosyltransferase involved in cell wall biosynthesis